MGWDDDWHEAKRQREEEDYDRWWAQREAERDADCGRYHRPTFSQEAWESYDSVWQERDRDNRALEQRSWRENEIRHLSAGEVDAAVYSMGDDDFEYTPSITTCSASASPASITASTEENPWLVLGATAALMLIVIANLGVIGIIACVVGWQIFLFFGWAIGGLLQRIFMP